MLQILKFLCWRSCPITLFHILLYLNALFLALILNLIVKDFCRKWKTTDETKERQIVKKGKKSKDEVEFIKLIWKIMLFGAFECNRRPFNIITSDIIEALSEPLQWSDEYKWTPDKIRVRNDGQSVVIKPMFSSIPILNGGPLLVDYELHNIRIIWGDNNETGSKHCINGSRYPLEIQMYFIKAHLPFDTDNGSYYTEGDGKDIVCIVSCLCELSNMDNVYLNPLILILKNIQYIADSCLVEPFPLNWIIPTFDSGYYVRSAHLNYPSCSEGIKWIIRSEPLTISARQLEQFRNLNSFDGPMVKDSMNGIRKSKKAEVLYYTSTRT